MTRFTDKKLGVVICKHLVEEKLPTLHVIRYADGEWAFSCGVDHHNKDGSDYVWVDIDHILSVDETIHSIAGLLSGFWAERDVIGGKWTLSRYLENT